MNQKYKEYRAVSSGYVFIQTPDGVIEVYNPIDEGDKSKLPVYSASCRCESRKDFEIEVSYILNDYL